MCCWYVFLCLFCACVAYPQAPMSAAHGFLNNDKGRFAGSYGSNYDDSWWGKSDAQWNKR